MNEGITVTEACEMKAMAAEDYARLCTQEGNDAVLYIAIGAAVGFVVLVAAILLSRRPRPRR